MANYANLLAAIAANIYTNGNQEVTAAMVKTAMNEVVNTLGAGYQFMGVAHPADTPSGYADLRAFWLAGEAGTYTDFGSLVVNDGEVAILKYNGSWSKEVTGAASAAQLNQLGQQLRGIIGVDVALPNFTQGYIANATTLIKQSSSSWSLSAPIFLKAGTLITINTSGNNCSLVLYAFRSDEYNMPLVVANDQNNVKIYNYLVPHDGNYIISYKHAATGAYVKLTYYEFLGTVIKAQLKGEQLVPVSWASGVLISSNAFVSNSAYRTSCPFKLGQGDVLEIYTDSNKNLPLVCDASNPASLVDLITTPADASVGTMVRYTYSPDSDKTVLVCYRFVDASSYVYLHRKSYFDKVLDDELNKDAFSELSVNYPNHKAITASNFYQSTNASYDTTAAIFLKKGTTIKINTSAGSGIALVCGALQNGTLVSALLVVPSSVDTTVNTVYNYSVADDGYYVISYKTSVAGAYCTLIVPPETPCVSTRLDDIEAAIGKIGKKHLRILLLGNSYASDAWGYVPFILKNYGITCDIYMYWRGALSLDDLVTFWESSDQQDATSPQASQGTYRYLYHIDTRTMTSWASLPRQSAKELVAMGSWDIITLQQWSVYTISNTMTNPYFEQVVDLIRQSLSTPYTLGWQMSWTRPVYNGVDVDKKQDNLDVAELINKQHAANIVFPCASAIFNCRENHTLAAIGDSTYHNLWASDNVHLEEGLPCYIAGLAVVQALFNKYYPEKCVLGDITRPTNSNITAWDNPQRQMPTGGTITSITDENCLLAQNAAIIANKFPYEINGV